MKLIINQLGGIEYCYAHSTLGEALPEFKRNGFGLCSLRDIAKLRILEGRMDGGVTEMTKDYTASGTSSQFDEGPYLVREGVLCLPGRNPRARLIRNSPFSLNPKGVFHPNKEQVKKALENSIEFPVIKGSSGGISFKTNSFSEGELPVFLFGGGDKELAGQYGRILNGSGVDEIHVYPVFAESIDGRDGRKVPYIEYITYGRDWDDFRIVLHRTFIYPHTNCRVYGIWEKQE
jgi:hypothetical protein